MTSASKPKYRLGDRVRVRTGTPPHHIRTPAYVQGKTGRVVLLLGPQPNPESLAHGGDGRPEVPLYQVGFDGAEVWGNSGSSRRDDVRVDIFEHWLEPA